MNEYYAKRAKEYEKVYARPERQESLDRLKDDVIDRYLNADLLEIACGTGYWTRLIAQGAQSIVACDISPEVLEIAKGKDYTGCDVTFLLEDAYALSDKIPPRGNAFLAFWFSHIDKIKRRPFFDALHARLEPGAGICLIDNKYVEGSSTPLARSDGNGNTFQIRTLEDGTSHEVMKNFPDEGELVSFFSQIGCEVEYKDYQYYWMLAYKLP